MSPRLLPIFRRLLSQFTLLLCLCAWSWQSAVSGPAEHRSPGPIMQQAADDHVPQAIKVTPLHQLADSLLRAQRLDVFQGVTLSSGPLPHTAHGNFCVRHAADLPTPADSPVALHIQLQV